MGRGKSTKSPQTRVMLEESKGERGALRGRGGEADQTGANGRAVAGRPAGQLGVVTPSVIMPDALGGKIFRAVAV